MMDIIPFAIALACAWVAAKFWFFPIVSESWRSGDMAHKLARAGSLVVIEKLKDLAAVGTLTLTAVTAFVGLMGAYATDNSAFSQSVISNLDSLRAFLGSWGKDYATATAIIGLMGAALALFLAARYAKSRVAEVWEGTANKIHAELLEDEQRLIKARDNSEFTELVDHIGELNQILVTGNDPSGDPLNDDVRADLLP